MKNEYLRELLRDNKTVIVPGLGAFVNNESKTQPIIFNAFLKFNDGLVVGFISKKEGISTDEASKKNEVFVSGVLSLLDSGRDVRIDGIGILKKDTDGKLQFTYNDEAKIRETEKEKENIIQQEKEIKAEEERIKQEKILAEKKRAEEIAAEERKKAELLKAEKENTRIAEEEKKKIPAEKAPEKIAVNEIPIEEKKQEKIEIPVENKTSPDKNKAEKIPAAAKPRKKKRLVLILTLLVLLGGGGAAGYFYKEQIMALMQGNPTASSTSVASSSDKEKEKPETDEATVTEEPAEVSNITEELPVITEEANTEVVEEVPAEKIEEKIVTPVKTSTPVPAESGSYYVIAGCFQNATNAETMIQRANAKGLSGMNIGTFGNLIHVAVYSSSDRSQAMHKAREVRNDFPNAWVMRKK